MITYNPHEYYLLSEEEALRLGLFAQGPILAVFPKGQTRDETFRLMSQLQNPPPKEQKT